MSKRQAQMNNMPILVIDDDKELCQLLIEFLTPEGFEISTCYDPHEGLQLAKRGNYSLVLLDIMLPGMTGLELLRILRTTSQIPVLMLTAKGEDIDRIIGLEMGADDYLAKPFNPRELLARIKAIKRRTQVNGQLHTQTTPLVCEDLCMDFATRTMTKNGATINLTAMEFSLIHELLQHAGQVMSRADLTRTILHRELDLFDRSIDVHISSLRKKLGHKIANRERIKTIRGVGYLYTKES